MWMTFVLVLPHGVSIPTRNVGEQYRHVRPRREGGCSAMLSGGWVSDSVGTTDSRVHIWYFRGHKQAFCDPGYSSRVLACFRS